MTYHHLLWNCLSRFSFVPRTFGGPLKGPLKERNKEKRGIEAGWRANKKEEEMRWRPQANPFGRIYSENGMIDVIIVAVLDAPTNGRILDCCVLDCWRSRVGIQREVTISKCLLDNKCETSGHSPSCYAYKRASSDKAGDFKVVTSCTHEQLGSHEKKNGRWWVRRLACECVCQALVRLI